MKFLFLSKEGDALGIAHKVKQEGHSVKMHIEDAKYRMAGKGLIDLVTAYRPQIPWADVIVCDMVGFGDKEKVLRKGNKPVLSCSQVMDMAELDRSKGIDLLVKAGIDIPFTRTYDNPADALELIGIWEDGFVIKPHGNQDTASTLLLRHKEQLGWALSLYKGPITVQALVTGVEVSTEGWYNGRGFMTPFNHTFEEKTLLPTGGANTGCMGNVVINAGTGNKLVEHTVARLDPFLKQVGYRGPIDVNCIVTSDRAYALELTCRLGYDAIEALSEGLREPLSDVLFETAIGVKKTIELGQDKMIAVRLSKAPYPNTEPSKEDIGMPILGINEENLKHIYMTDVYKEGNDYKYAASDGVLIKATAHGKSVDDARNRVYRTINSISYPNKQYRDDIGMRVNKDMEQLKTWGWL